VHNRARMLRAASARGFAGTLNASGRGAAPWLLGIIGAAGVLTAGGAATAWATCPCGKLPVSGEAARVVVGLCFVAVGLIAMSQRRRRRIGLLMVAVGLTWFIYDVGWVYEPLTYTIGTLGAGLYQPILAHLTVVFPSGRIRSPLDRTVVVGAYGLYGLASLGTQVLWDPRDSGCPCPANLLLLHRDASLYAIAEQVSSALLIVVTAAVLAVLVWHWRRAGLPGRRALTPVLASSIPIAGLVVATTIVGQNFLPPLAVLALTALPLSFLAGLLRLRLERAAVGSLVVELEGSARVGRIRDALARTLHDRTLEVAYWVPSQEGYVDADGRPLSLPPGGSDRSVTLLERAGQPVAALIHDAAVDNNPELVEAAAAVARLALENERLQAEIKAQLQQVRASRARIVATGDAERRRIERDLHDGAQQRLVTLSLVLGLARDQAVATADVALEDVLDEAAEQLRLALAELRELARGIHPAVLSEAGLHAAIETLADRLPVAVTVSSGPTSRFEAAVEAAAYFVVAEALTNVVKYARASDVRVTVMYSDAHLTVGVVDDGVGGADPSHGSGLVGLMDRVGALGGRLEIVSEPGNGTRVTAMIPCLTIQSPGSAGDDETRGGSAIQ
jgi:signal transduction histidine kinase